MPSKKTPADTPKAPATGKSKAKAKPPKADTPKPTPATVQAKAAPKAKTTPGPTPKAKATPVVKSKPPTEASAAPTESEDRAQEVATKVAEKLGFLVDRPSLELLGVLHGESLTTAQVTKRFVVGDYHPMEPLRKHKLVEGDKARRFAPTAKGREVWAWAVQQAGR